MEHCQSIGFVNISSSYAVRSDGGAYAKANTALKTGLWVLSIGCRGSPCGTRTCWQSCLWAYSQAEQLRYPNVCQALFHWPLSYSQL